MLAGSLTNEIGPFSVQGGIGSCRELLGASGSRPVLSGAQKPAQPHLARNGAFPLPEPSIWTPVGPWLLPWLRGASGWLREHLGAAGRRWTIPMKESIDFACWKLNKRNRTIFGAGRYRELPGAPGSLGKSPGPLRRPETCSATPGPKWSISITRTIHFDPCRPLAASLAPRELPERPEDCPEPRPNP